MKVKVILIILLFVSVFFNLYTYGYKAIYVKGFNAGVNTVSNQVLSEYNANKQLTLVVDGKQVVLKENQPESAFQ